MRSRSGTDGAGADRPTVAAKAPRRAVGTSLTSSACRKTSPGERRAPRDTEASADRLRRALVRASRGERVVLRHGRRTVAAVVPIEDLERLRRLDDAADRRAARAALREARRKGTIPWERVKSELGL